MRSQLAQIAADDDAIRLSEPLLGNCRRGDTYGCFPRRRAPSTSMIPNAILLPIGIVGMTRAKRIDEVAVILAPGIFIPDQQGNRRTSGLAFKHAGKNFDGIGFLPLRHMAGGAGLTAVEFLLDVFNRQRKTWRTPIDHAADRRSMALTEGRDREDVTKRITGHSRTLIDDIQFDLQLLQLISTDRGRSIRQWALGALRFGEGDHVTNGIRPAQKHDQAIKAERDPAVRRRTVIQRFEQEPELGMRLFFADSQQI